MLLEQVVRTPFVQSTSFTATGTPASLPSGCPAARFASTATACWRTTSSSRETNALSFGSRSRYAARKASAISAALALPAAWRARNSVAVFSIMTSVQKNSPQRHEDQHKDPPRDEIPSFL